MSCRWARQADPGSSAWLDPAAASAYLDLARTGRRDDFRWLALSHGMPPAEVEGFWRRTVARLDPRPSAAGRDVPTPGPAVPGSGPPSPPATR